MHEPIEKRREPGDRFVLRTLGGVSLAVVHPDGTSSIVLRPSKPLALLTYLTFSHHRSASRSALIALLWDGQEPAKAHGSLRVALNTLRSIVSVDVVADSADPVRLNVQIGSDRDALLDASKRRDHATVVDLYEGQFFPDYAAPGCGEFERWVDVQRATLQSTFREAAAEIAKNQLSEGRFRDSEILAARVRDDDPQDEAAWYLLFDVLIAGRNTLRLASELAEFNRMLAGDGGESASETQALLQRVHEALDDGPHPLKVDLVGREREFSTVLRAWRRAREGRGEYVHITADAGLGKTRLLEVVRERLRALKVRVVLVSANHGTRELGYSLASEIAAALAEQPGALGVPIGVPSALVALNPGLSKYFRVEPDPSGGDEALHHRAVAIRELIAAIAAEKPFALLIDDLHWCDALSLRLLNALFPMLADEGVLVLSTSRFVHGDAHVPPHARRITLEALDTDDIVALLSSIAPLPDERWPRNLPAALLAATHGSPLLILETLQLLRERGILSFSSDGWILEGDADALLAQLEEGSALSHRISGVKGIQRHLLLLLAVAGVPLSADQLRHASSVVDVGAALAALEQRGLAVMHENQWTTAHDEYAAALVKAASPEEVRSAASAIGRVLADDAGRSMRQHRLAAMLLARGEDADALARLFPRFESAMRDDGDSRSAYALAFDFLGSAATSALASSLARALPWLVRTRLNSIRRAAVAATLVAIPLIAVAATAIVVRPRRAPEATLLLQRQSVDGTAEEFSEVPLDAQQVASTSPIDVDVRQSAAWHLPMGIWRYMQDHTPRPDGHGWAATRAVPDSGVLDVFDVRLDGSARRLTWARLDDLAGSWSPDSRQLAFLTMRWSSHGHYDVAVYDTLTRKVRRLTGPHEETDVGPRWSPDGSRIAFDRHSAATGGVSLCIVDEDGANLRCLPTVRGRGTGVLGWADVHRVFMQIPQAGGVALFRVDVDTGEEVLVRSDVANVDISPDGRYLLCTCKRRGYPAGTRFLFSAEAPDELTVVRYAPPVGEDVRGFWVSWSPTSPTRPHLAHLRVLNGPGGPLSGFPYQLRVTGIDNAGHPIDVGVVRWRSLDSTAASVDSSGILRAHHAGPVTVYASAGGWVRERFDISVATPLEPRTVLDERWIHALEPTWVPFGQPEPMIVESDRFGRAFTNNGDGSFWSGAYTARAFDTRNGLWVEAEMSVPLTMPPGPSQEQLVTLFAVHDTLRWKTWDRVTGDHPPVPFCRFRYPLGLYHRSAGDSLSVDEESIGAQTFPVPGPLRDGQPFKTIVQIFPDGRCGFAIDGMPIFISRPAYFDTYAHVMLVGNTQETRNLVGRVQVNTGIAPFVKWMSERENKSSIVSR